MNTEFLIALLSLAGTFIGSLAGILTANKLTNYRIEQLEKKARAEKQPRKKLELFEKLKELKKRL